MKQSEKLSQVEQEELQKCKESHAYFYNKYVRKEDQEELTEEQYEELMIKIVNDGQEFISISDSFKKHMNYPLIPNDCYNKNGFSFFNDMIFRSTANISFFKSHKLNRNSKGGIYPFPNPRKK